VKQQPSDKEPGNARPSTFDAKAFLELTLPQQSGDVLKVTPIPPGDSFRVNWYAGRADQTTARCVSVLYIRDSKFLYCRLDDNGEARITYPRKQ
jgi:hypothetical protein